MKPEAPEPVKLFIGALYNDAERLQMANERIISKLGTIDYKSPEFDFKSSDYYKEEMGWPLRRRFISLHQLINPKDIARIKIITNAIEDDLATDRKRTINLDPGYMDYNKIVLASAKYNGQKIYIDSGIYADPTLWYEKGAYQDYPFSFPDFKAHIYDEVFLHIRALYKGQLRNLKKNTKGS